MKIHSMLFILIYSFAMLDANALANTPIRFKLTIPSQQAFYFLTPKNTAVDTNNNVFVLDSENCTVQKFSDTGTLLSRWGAPGTSNGYFTLPSSITADTQGNIYIADSGNSRIQKFNNDGTYLLQWQSPNCKAIVADKNDNLYVTGNNTIQKLDPYGTQIDCWGGNGTGNGQFYGINHIAIDGNNNVYVADIGNYRIQKFDRNGNFLGKFGSQGSGDGQFYRIDGLAVDSNDYIYVCTNYRIKKFNSNFTYIGEFHINGTPWGLNIDNHDHILVSCSSYVAKLTSQGDLASIWECGGSADGKFKTPKDVAVDSNGHIYVADYGNCRIQKFDRTGKFILSWTLLGGYLGYPPNPLSIVIDSNNNIIVLSYSMQNHLQKYDSNGKYLCGGIIQGLNFSEKDIKIDSSDNIYAYAIGPYGNGVYKFDSNLHLLEKTNLNCSNDFTLCDGYFSFTTVGHHIYATIPSKINKYDLTGSLILSWGSDGTAHGEFIDPVSIAISKDSNLYVADTGNLRIERFDYNGNFNFSFGKRGPNPGEFYSISSLLVDKNGLIYVADEKSNRIQVFQTIEISSPQILLMLN